LRRLVVGLRTAGAVYASASDDALRVVLVMPATVDSTPEICHIPTPVFHGDAVTCSVDASDK
jgi:hypothetical protein